MVKFDDNQFEIAIVTYKRHEYIESWLEIFDIFESIVV